MGSVWVARMKGIPSIVGAVRVGGCLEARVGYLSTVRIKMGLQNPYKYKYSCGRAGWGDCLEATVCAFRAESKYVAKV